MITKLKSIIKIVIPSIYVLYFRLQHLYFHHLKFTQEVRPKLWVLPEEHVDILVMQFRYGSWL